MGPPFRPPHLQMGNLSGGGTGPGYGHGGLPNSIPQPQTPNMRPPTPHEMMPSTPKGMPPVIPFGAMNPAHVVARGQPPAFHPPPFKMPGPPPPLQGGPDMQLALLGQTMPGPGGSTVPSMAGYGTQAGAVSPGQPLPPPPPREDDSAFVRRVRLIYMDRVMREHQKQDILELDAVGRPIPQWIFNMSAFMPYVACATFIGASGLIIMTYSLKFNSDQEQHWYLAVMVGFFMVVFLLDVIRSAVLTIVELRKYEIRKRSKAGDFVVRKIMKTNEEIDIPAMLKPKPKVKAVPTPYLPKASPKFNNMERPRFLPDVAGGTQGMMNGNMIMGGGPPPGGMPPPPGYPGNRTPPGGRRTPPTVPYGAQDPNTGSRSPSQISQSLAATLAERRRESGAVTPPDLGGSSRTPTNMGGGKPPPPPPPMGRMAPGGSGSRPGTPRSTGSRSPRGPPMTVPRPPPPPPS